MKVDNTPPETKARVRAKLSQLERSESQIGEIKRKARIETFLEKAETAFNIGDITQALASYKEVLLLEPQHVLAHMNMGNIYQELKLTDEAENAYLKTIKANPFYVFGSLALARLYVFSGQPDKALTILQNTLAWYRGDHEVSLFMGLAYAFKKDAQRAVEEFEKSIKLNPEYPLAHFYLGVQTQKSNPTSSKRHLQSFLNLVQNQPQHGGLIQKAENLLKKL